MSISTQTDSSLGPIIVVDDDLAIRRACEAALKRAGYEVETFPDGPSGIERAGQIHPPVLVTDLKMPGMSGIEVIEHVRKLNPEIVIVVITGFATVDTAVEAMKGGAYDFVPKPFTADELRTIIRRAVERWRLGQETKRLQAEKAAQARRFITFVSHQLQSPLGAVRQYLDVLMHQAGDELAERPRQWIVRSRAKIAEMLRIIDDWLTLSKVEGGQLATERTPVHWPELVAETLAGVSTAAESNGVTLDNQVPADLPPVVGDRAALGMLLANLVSNAIKYNRDNGRVTITGGCDKQTVEISVADTGIGIAPDQVPNLFGEFFRVKDGSTAGISGTGMGLAICRKIARELGGDVTLVSTPGQGSTFTVTLPRDTGQSAATPADD